MLLEIKSLEIGLCPGVVAAQGIVAILQLFPQLAPVCPGPVALRELRGGCFGVQLELGCAMVGFIPRKCGWEQQEPLGESLCALNVSQHDANNELMVK